MRLLTTVTEPRLAYLVATAGTFNLGGINSWSVNDLAIKTKTGWVRSRPGATNWGAIVGSLADQTDLSNALALKANTTAVVLKTGAQTIAGVKTFEDIPLVPTIPVLDAQVASKYYVDEVAKRISTGCITPPTLTDNGDGTVTVSSVVANVMPSSNFSGTMLSFTIAEATLGLFTDGGVEEYVGIEYNSGSPRYYRETLGSRFNHSDLLPVFVIWRLGNTIHSLGFDSLGVGLANKLQSAVYHTHTYARSIDGGLIITETTSPVSRTIAVTGGLVYTGAIGQNVLPYDSSVDELTLAYHSGGVWMYTDHTQYNNTQYDNGTDLQPITANRYAVRWWYRSIGDAKQLFYVLGSIGNHKTAEAAATESPRTDIPSILKHHCLLIGRSIIAYNAATGITQSVLEEAYLAPTLISHNSTLDIQGGQEGQYYHLTAAQHAALAYTNVANNFSAQQTMLGAVIGDVVNNVTITATGDLSLNGAATVFKDINLAGSTLVPSGAGAPDLINFAGSAELRVQGFDGGSTPERLFGSMEMQHDYKSGSDIEVHIHWTPTTAGTGNVKWRVYYSWCVAGEVFTAPQLLTVVSAATGAWKSTYASLGTISGLGKVMNSQLVLQVARDPTDPEDTYAADAALIQVGIHYEVDSMGSRQMTVK